MNNGKNNDKLNKKAISQNLKELKLSIKKLRTDNVMVKIHLDIKGTKKGI